MAKKSFISFSKKSLTALAMAGVMVVSSAALVGCANGQDGKDGLDGTIWKSGTNHTSFTDAKVGDYFIDTDDYILYQKDADSWTVVMENYGKSGENGKPGAAADNIEVRTEAGQIQWRYKTGSDISWKTLIDITTVNSRQVVLQATNDYIQWKYEGDETWKNLISVASLKGTDTGTTWHCFAGEPSNSFGKDGDFFLNETTSDIFKKTSGAWAKIGNISGGGISNAVWEGKKASFYGDSLTEANWHYNKGYYTYIQQMLGLSAINNYGKSGYTIADVYNRIKITTDTADLVFVMCGVNDQTFSVPLGKFGDQTADTTYGSLHLLCKTLREKYPTSFLLFITPHYQTNYPHTEGITSYEVSKAIKEVCEKFSIPVYDNYVMSGINADNLKIYTTDNCHWTDRAHEMIGKNIATYVLTNFAGNYQYTAP